VTIASIVGSGEEPSLYPVHLEKKLGKIGERRLSLKSVVPGETAQKVGLLVTLLYSISGAERVGRAHF